MLGKIKTYGLALIVGSIVCCSVAPNSLVKNASDSQVASLDADRILASIPTDPKALETIGNFSILDYVKKQSLKANELAAMTDIAKKQGTFKHYWASLGYNPRAKQNASDLREALKIIAKSQARTSSFSLDAPPTFPGSGAVGEAEISSCRTLQSFSWACANLLNSSDPLAQAVGSSCNTNASLSQKNQPDCDRQTGCPKRSTQAQCASRNQNGQVNNCNGTAVCINVGATGPGTTFNGLGTSANNGGTSIPNSNGNSGG